MSKEKKNFLKNIKENNINERVIKSIDGVDRENFFDQAFKNKVYECEKLPIGNGQRSDDPLTLAKMIDILNPQESWRILEIGTGSGYSTAIMSPLAEEVITIDYYENLVINAKSQLLNIGHENIRFFSGDASDLEDSFGFFDGIIILSACRLSPYSILNMLKPHGRAVFPMGPPHQQQIVSFENSSADINVQNFRYHDFCIYESMRGKYGWVDQDDSYIVDEATV